MASPAHKQPNKLKQPQQLKLLNLTIYIIRVTLNTESDTVDIRRRPAYMAYP